MAVNAPRQKRLAVREHFLPESFREIQSKRSAGVLKNSLQGYKATRLNLK